MNIKRKIEKLVYSSLFNVSIMTLVALYGVIFIISIYLDVDEEHFQELQVV